MDQKQFDALLSDAETRLRRLKVLYEQWFMGIERVEPGQARKEFEDLLAHMRKEQTNNTAQRFRLQQLVQRHVALSTHWRRVGRQIEEGTYQRDLVRAKKRRQPGAAGRDLDEPDLDVQYDVEVDEDLAAALAEADRLAEAPPPPPPEPVPQSSKRGRTQAGVGPAMPLTAAGSVRPPLQPDAGPPAHSLSPFAVPAADAQRAKSMTPSNPPVAPAPLNKQPLAAAASARGAAAPGGARLPSPPLPGGLLGGVPGRMSAPGAPPVPTTAGRMSAPQAAAPAVPATSGRMSQAGAPPVPGAGARAAARAPQASGPPKTPGSAAQSGGPFSAQDIDRVYNQYVAARGRNAERTDNVKRETIEKTIRGMLPQLEQKHPGKKVDFEIVVKDGRVALKPVAK